jgi:O-antigen/teichoic acid export membrane protein
MQVAVGTRRRHIVSQVGLSSATNIVIAISKLGVLPLLAYALSQAEFGAYSLITAATGFGLVSLGLGVHSYTYRLVPGLDLAAGRRNMSTTALFEVLLAATLLVTALITGIGAELLRLLRADDYKPAFALGGVWLLIELFVLNMRSYLYATQMIGHANVIDLLRQVAWMPIVVVYWLVTRTLTIEAVLGTMIVGSMAAAIYGAAITRPFVRVGIDPQLLSKALAFGVPLVLPAANLSIMRLGERSIMSASRSLEDVAAFSLVAAFASGLYSCTGLAIDGVLMPRALQASNKGDHASANSVLWTSLKFSGWAFALVAFTAWLLIPEIVGLVAPRYSAGFGLFPAIALSYLVLIASRTPHNALVLLNRTRAILAIDAVSLGIALGLDLLLIPRMGILGAAIASILAFGFSGFGKALVVDMLGAVPWRQLVTPNASRVAAPEFMVTPPEGPG